MKDSCSPHCRSAPGLVPTLPQVPGVLSWIPRQLCHRLAFALSVPARCCHLHANSCHARAPLTLIRPDSAFLLSFSAGEWHMPTLSLLIPCSWHMPTLCPFSFPAPGTSIPLGHSACPLAAVPV